jgi:uncharacterized protein YqeY
MSIKETLQADLTEAIRGRNEIVSGTIRMVLTAITNEEVSGKEARVLTDAEIITVLSREAKKRREAAEAFGDAGRADKAALEKAEGEVIAKYLPEQMSEDEIKKFIDAIFSQTYTLLGMFLAWMVFEGSVRTVATYAIGLTIVIDVAYNTLKKDE